MDGHETRSDLSGSAAIDKSADQGMTTSARGSSLLNLLIPIQEVTAW